MVGLLGVNCVVWGPVTIICAQRGIFEGYKSGVDEISAPDKPDTRLRTPLLPCHKRKPLKASK